MATNEQIKRAVEREQEVNESNFESNLKYCIRSIASIQREISEATKRLVEERAKLAELKLEEITLEEVVG